MKKAIHHPKSPSQARIRIRWPLVALLLALAMLAVSSCTTPPPATPQASRPVTATRPPQPTSPPAAATAAPDEPLSLVWWTPEFLSPQAPQPGGALLAEQLAAFSEAQGGKVNVQAVRKARYGKGGLLDTLRTAAPIAPATLPDIVALDVAEVEKAVEAGLLQPLDSLLNAGVTEKLYPFATEAGRFGESLYAVQYLADAGHTAFLPAQVPQAPDTWAKLIEAGVPYLFPMAQPQAGSPQGSGGPSVEGLSQAVLAQYLSAGATLGADRKLMLEPQPLLKLLTFYQDASKAGVLPPAALELADGEAVWNVFSQGQTPQAYVSARRYKTGGVEAGYAAAPGEAGPTTGVTSGWALAIVTPDPKRQQAAAELIAWLLKPENAGEWAARAGWLPTSPDALKTQGSDPYWGFVDAELAKSRSAPVGQDYPATAARIQAAIEAVVRDGTEAAKATEAAVNGQP